MQRQHRLVKRLHRLEALLRVQVLGIRCFRNLLRTCLELLQRRQGRNLLLGRVRCLQVARLVRMPTRNSNNNHNNRERQRTRLEHLRLGQYLVLRIRHNQLLEVGFLGRKTQQQSRLVCNPQRRICLEDLDRRLNSSNSNNLNNRRISSLNHNSKINSSNNSRRYLEALVNQLIPMQHQRMQTQRLRILSQLRCFLPPLPRQRQWQ